MSKAGYILICLFISYISIISSTRVLHIGIDGLLQKCMFKGKHTVFDFFKTQGSTTFVGRTAIQTISAPGWSNLLCGMDSETTGIVTNDWFAPWLFEAKNNITPVTGNSTPINCIFNTIKSQKPAFVTASVYDWDWFTMLSNMSMPNTLNYDYFCNGTDVKAYEICDELAVQRAKEIIDNDFNYFFLYLGQVDESGHFNKFCSDEYVKAITKVNDIIERIFYLLKQKKIFEDTYIILTTDHGANFMDNNHGFQNDDNILVPWFIVGPGIKKGYTITTPVKNLDTPATVCQILGINPHPLWKSRVVSDIFESKSNLK